MTFPAESSRVTGGVYLDNLVNIGRFLMANGYSREAAAGIAGVIAGESSGNPEAVQAGGSGRGLIQWSYPAYPSPDPNIMTGNVQKDWQAQLTDLLTYANTNSAEAVRRGGVDLATLKKATNPQQAAQWWSAFEGPLVAGSDIRSGTVSQVYAALGGKGGSYTPVQLTSTQPNTGTGTSTGTSGGSGGGISNPLDFQSDWIKGFEWITGKVTSPVTSEASGIAGIFSGVTEIGSQLSNMAKLMALLFRPSFWLRVGAFLVGLLALWQAFHFLKAALSSETGEI